MGPTQPPVQCVPGYFPGGKRPGRESSSNAEVKNEWSFTSTPPIFLRGVEKRQVYLLGRISQVRKT
jgi:hypothetical protein